MVLHFLMPICSSSARIWTAPAKLTPWQTVGDNAERNAEYRSAIDNGDTRRADEIASAPIPDDWTEHERAIWHARRAIARAPGQEPASVLVDPTQRCEQRAPTRPVRAQGSVPPELPRARASASTWRQERRGRGAGTRPGTVRGRLHRRRVVVVFFTLRRTARALPPVRRARPCGAGQFPMPSSPHVSRQTDRSLEDEHRYEGQKNEDPGRGGCPHVKARLDDLPQPDRKNLGARIRDEK